MVEQCVRLTISVISVPEFMVATLAGDVPYAGSALIEVNRDDIDHLGNRRVRAVVIQITPGVAVGAVRVAGAFGKRPNGANVAFVHPRAVPGVGIFPRLTFHALRGGKESPPKPLWGVPPLRPFVSINLSSPAIIAWAAYRRGRRSG